MSRVELTVQDGRRIDTLMEHGGVSHTTTPRHPADTYGVLDRYGVDATAFSVTSDLARFLMRKGVLRPGQKLGVDNGRYFTEYEVDVAQVWESARYHHGEGARTWRIRRVSVG